MPTRAPKIKKKWPKSQNWGDYRKMLLAIWVELKTVVRPYSKPKNSLYGPKKNHPKFRQNSKAELKELRK